MRAIAILLLALSSMSIATPPGPIIAWVRPIETIGGHLVRFTDNSTVVTVRVFWYPADTKRTVLVQYVDLKLSQIDTLDITSIMNPLLDSKEKRDGFRASSFAMSPNGKFMAMRLDQEGSVAVIRLDSLSLISSFKEETVRNENYNSDVAILLSDDLTIALNNEDGGTTFLDGRAGSIIRTDPDSRMAVDRSLSPDSSTVAECSSEDLIGELVDFRGRWRIRLSREACVLPTYSPDGRYLASMNDAPNTIVWDLSPFPPHNPVSGKVILVDSLGLPLEGLEVRISTSHLKPVFADSIDYLGYFHATTNRDGSIPMVVPKDGRYNFSYPV